MLSSHETCPICKRGMIHSNKINKECLVLDNKKMSFVESICNQTAVDNNVIQHVFFQITSLYGELLFTRVQLNNHALEITVNYPKHDSEIKYLTKAYFDHKTQTWSGGNPESIKFDNTLLDLDFPDLSKTIKRAKILAPFL